MRPLVISTSTSISRAERSCPAAVFIAISECLAGAGFPWCSVPVIATVVLFTSVNYWNEYFQGLVLMNSEDKYPLQTYIRQITVQIPANVTLTTEQYQQLAKNSNKALEAAKVFIAMIPMLIVYPFLQKYFVSGITLGAVKG